MPGLYSTILDRARPAWMRPQPVTQFDIPSHYDLMVELDSDVHEDLELSRSEVELALRLLGRVPESVFLPCFGTGRHIPPLLEAGVKRIVGVDVSNASVAKAVERLRGDARVELIVADLTKWNPKEQFEAVLLLGNSFGDVLDWSQLRRFVSALSRSLKADGLLIMDYIGQGYSHLYQGSDPLVWFSSYLGKPVKDSRKVCFCPDCQVLTIHIQVRDRDSGEHILYDTYKKVVLASGQVERLFGEYLIGMTRPDMACEINPYYSGLEANLGMLACSTWWVGKKLGPVGTIPPIPPMF